mmetsp:Transcript_33623/g.62122  ORF Transcript_33623/g.62122 Transcript_33623/m.62122 type:complete len:213 (+) Transcript_33623:84-722(+)
MSSSVTANIRLVPLFSALPSFEQVLLMILFGVVKRLCRENFSLAIGAIRLHHLARNLLLLLGMIINPVSVLHPSVVPDLVQQVPRIPQTFHSDPDEFLVVHHLGIVQDVDGFRVTRRSGAHVSVGRIHRGALSVPHLCPHHAGNSHVLQLASPKAPQRDGRYFVPAISERPFLVILHRILRSDSRTFLHGNKGGVRRVRRPRQGRVGVNGEV